MPLPFSIAVRLDWEAPLRWEESEQNSLWGEFKSPVPGAGFTTGLNLGQAGKVTVFDSRASNPPQIYFSHPHNWMMFIPCS